MTFTWSAKVDGSNVADIVLAGGSIEYGRTTVQEQPNVPVAVLELLTRDTAAAVVDGYPEFGLGDWASDLSGFDDAYLDPYEGVTSRLTIGVPVVIGAGTESGFTDVYADAYAGTDLVRYTGRCQAMDYTPGTIQLTATPRSEEWSRIFVGGTGVDETIPVESDSARCIRYAAEAGIDLIVEGPPSATIIEVPPETPAVSLTGHLYVIMNDTGGLAFTDRDSFVHIRTRDYVPPSPRPPVVLPPGAVLVDPIAMSLDLGLVRNRVTVVYGPVETSDGGTVFSGVWRFATGGPPPTLGHFVRVNDGSPAPGETDTLHLSNTDDAGTYWPMTQLTTDDTVRLSTAAGDTVLMDVTAVAHPVPGPTGYTTITATITATDGTIAPNEYVTIQVLNANVKARPTLTVDDPAQIAQYGLRDYRTETVVNDSGSAAATANRILDALSPSWSMPDVTVNLNLCTDQEIAQILALEQGDTITVPNLLPGAPIPEYTAEVLGYSEVLSRTAWLITFHLFSTAYAGRL